MRTTLNLETDVLEAVRRFSKARTLTKAVNEALKEWMHRKAVDQLRELKGKVEFDFDFKKARLDDWDKRLKKQVDLGHR